MPGSSRALVVLGAAVLVLCVIPVVLAAVPYGLDSPSEVDVSDRAAMIGYEFHNFDGVARVERGEELVVRATAPESAVYGVDLYNSDRRPVAFSARSLRGNDSTSFETGHLVPGTYVAALIDDSELKAVLPVVVEGYAVSVDDLPESVETGEELTVTATLSKHPASPEASRVELVVIERPTGYIVTRRDMTADETTDGTEYATTVRLSYPGEYQAYVNVRGQKSVRGHRVVLGFSDPHRLSVTGAPAPVGASDDATSDAADTRAPSEATAGPGSRPAPEGVITRNATLGPPSTEERRPIGALSVLLALVLAIGLLYWVRR